MEERRLRRIEIFRRDVLLQRAAAEGDYPPAQVCDREHDPVAEAVIWHRNVVAGNQQARFDHVLDRHAVAAEMFLQRKALGRRIAETELVLDGGIEPAVGEITARLGAGARGERRLEELGGEFHHLVQGLAMRRARLVFPGHFRQRHAGEVRQLLDRFGEAQPLGLHHEIENAAVLAG